MQLQLKSPQGLKHDITEMTLGRGRSYNYKSWNGTYTCPVCNRHRRANLNFVGHSSKVYCNGVKSAIQHLQWGQTPGTVADLFKRPRAHVCQAFNGSKYFVDIKGRPTKWFDTREAAQAAADKHNNKGE